MDSQDGVKPPVFQDLLELAYLLMSQVRKPSFLPAAKTRPRCNRMTMVMPKPRPLIPCDHMEPG